MARSAVAIITVGVSGLFVSRPKPGTIEWHKREYRAAERKLKRERQRTFLDAVQDKCRHLLALGDPGHPDTHIKALLDRGYLEKREFGLRDYCECLEFGGG